MFLKINDSMRNKWWKQTEVRTEHGGPLGHLMQVWAMFAMMNLKGGECILNEVLYCCF